MNKPEMTAGMRRLPHMLSLSRVVLAIVFYILFVYAKFDTRWFLVVLFVLIEFSDFFDGFVARKYKLVSDMGKLLDPCCDIVSHFLCLFALREGGRISSVIVAVFVFREVWMLFLRTVLQARNHVLPAGPLGKIKTAVYAIGIGLVLFFDLVPLLLPAHISFLLIDILFYLATFLSVLSAVQYYAAAIPRLKLKN